MRSLCTKVYGSEEATRHLSFEPRTIEQVEGIIKAAMESATAEPPGRTGHDALANATACA
jgi:hypothetical protein